MKGGEVLSKVPCVSASHITLKSAAVTYSCELKTWDDGHKTGLKVGSSHLQRRCFFSSQRYGMARRTVTSLLPTERSTFFLS